MSRPLWLVLAALVLAAGAVGFAFSKAATADGPAAQKRLAYLYVSGRGPTARAWYQGAPPSGTPVQDALDKFTAEGYRYAAIASGGLPSQLVTSASPGLSQGDPALDASFLILLTK